MYDTEKKKLEETIKKDMELHPVLRKHLLGSERGNPSQVVTEDKYPDHVEVDLGGTGNRGKIYFNSSNEKESKERLDSFFKIAEHKKELLEKYKSKSSEDDP